MNDLIKKVDEYINAQANLDLLRFITCGSVDDGKSTLIGRVLYEAQLIFEDQVTNLQRESKSHGSQDGDIDLALLVDGLAAEREQGITIDVAYRFFLRTVENLLLQILQGTSNTRVIWLPEPLPPMSQ